MIGKPITLAFSMATTDMVTGWAEIPQGATKASVEIIFDTDTYSWGSDIAELKWTLATGKDAMGNTIEKSRSFDTAVTFSSSNEFRRSISTNGVGFIRVEMTTAAGTGDPNALAVVLFQ